MRSTTSKHPLAAATVIIGTILWAFPLYWLVNSAFKTTPALQSVTPQFIPAPPTFHSIMTAINKPLFWTALRNSLSVALATVVVCLIFGVAAAMVLTRFHFKFRNTYLVTLLCVQMLPGIALLIPLFITFREFGLLNSLLGLTLAYCALQLPFVIWVMRGFFQAIPAELEDSARIDGAGNLRLAISIYLPLVMPGMITASVFAFIGAWNDYLIALALLQRESTYTMTVWLVSFSTEIGTDYGGLLAASLIFTLPVAVFFVVVQRHLALGVSEGSVKG